MSLFGSLQLANNTLQAMQVGLHVVGNNIANANTPGFIREEVVYAPAPVQKKGDLVIGLGVVVEGIVQKADQFLRDRLRNATGDRISAETQEDAYAGLEQILGELSDTDLSTSFTDFFGAVVSVLDQPDDLAVRNLAVLQGTSLARDFNRFASQTEDLHERLNVRVNEIAGEINKLSEEIRKLNLQITEIEGGGISGSDAGGLRTQRANAVDELAKLVDIHAVEQPTGSLTVSIGGEFLVSGGVNREVFADDGTTNGRNTSAIRFVDVNAPLDVTSGELRGLYNARDDVVEGALDDLDELAGTLAFEFNKLYSQGQGLTGFQDVTSTNTVLDPEAPLDEAGLPFTPVNGTFDVLSRNTNTDVTTTHTIRVDLNGLDDDTSLADLAAQLSDVPGLQASVNAAGALELSTDAADTDFAFAGDNSGVLAALGINTFFTGSTAGTLGVNRNLHGIDNAGRFAASLGGIAEDARNAERLAEFYTRPLDSVGGASLADKYGQFANGVAQGRTVAKSIADGTRVFEATLEGEHQALSAVNLDEEAVRMISLQRAYQASARYIRTISDLLDVLVNL